MSDTTPPAPDRSDPAQDSPTGDQLLQPDGPAAPPPADDSAEDAIVVIDDKPKVAEEAVEGGEIEIASVPEEQGAGVIDLGAEISQHAAPPDGQAAGPAQEQRQEPAQAVSEGDGAQAPPAAPPTGSRVVVRYGLMRQLGEFRHNLDTPPSPGTKVVVRTERGVEIGEVLMGVGEGGDSACRRCISPSCLGQYIRECGPEYPYRRDGKVLRLANPQDIIDQRHLDSSAREEAIYCRQQIREFKLPMKIVTVEHLLGGERIIFYFASESRVDFRDLVRQLAVQYRTRIEMRQVGARDEARLVGDYERCGQQCCCQAFIKDLKPVSMRMAKTQKATLDPSKISGRCGRLMCCLRYEDAGYEELRKKLPRRNTWVRTKAGVVGKVFDTQIITQLVRLLLMDNTQVVVGNEDIEAFDVQAPPPPPPPEERRIREKKDRGTQRMLRDEFKGPEDKPQVATAALSPARAAPSQAEGVTPPGAESQPAEVSQAFGGDEANNDEPSGDATDDSPTAVSGAGQSPELSGQPSAPNNTANAQSRQAAPQGAGGPRQEGDQRRRRRRRRRHGRGGGNGKPGGQSPQQGG